ncbi:MAG: hypothetical protein M1385_01485 [Candidatus Marsarchaeota archaeon]|nr:hypothetical protein [Candidatus Marsarchaeota archaeon]
MKFDNKFKSRLLLFVLVIALLDSIYLTSVELNSLPLYCSHTGIINCGGVLSSKYANILGIPLAYYALGWSIVAIILFFLKNKKFETVKNFWYLIAIVAVLYSVSAMAALGEICEYCSLLDVTLIVVFIITIYSLKK